MFIPSRFGKYLLLEKLGSGGMAELFLAKQTGLKGFEKVVAIKRILPHLTESSEFVNMFINEAKLAALLNHQNIVQIYDLGNVDEVYFIAMEYIMGRDLRTLAREAVDRKLPLSIGHMLLIVSRISAALDYAHRKKDLSGRDLNLVHRDISPQNILISYEGEIKLVDFGIAKAATGAQETRTGVLKGKLAYMSPEQAWGKPIDRRSDVFSLGVVLYELLTNTRLFKGRDEISILEKVRKAEIPPPTEINAELSPELEAVILKALAGDVEQRYQSAAEMQLALENIISQKGYAFSSLSLANHMQMVYQDEILQDSRRMHLAASDSIAVPLEDRSTQVRPRSVDVEMPPGPPAGIQRSGRTVIRPTPVSGLSKAMVLSIFFLAGGTLLLLALLSDLPGIVRARQMVPFLEVVHDRTHGFLEEKGIMRSLAGFRKGLFAMVGAETTPLPVPPPAPKPVHSVTTSSAEDDPISDASNPFVRRPQPARTPNRHEIRQLFLKAKQQYNAGKSTETEKTLRKIIELDPSIHQAYHLLGTVFLERKEVDAALRIFSDASILFPDDPVLHFDVGAIYFQKGATSLAIAELTESLKLNPHFPHAPRARKMLKNLGVFVAPPPPVIDPTLPVVSEENPNRQPTASADVRALATPTVVPPGDSDVSVPADPTDGMD